MAETFTSGPWVIKRNPVTIAILDQQGRYITENLRRLPEQEYNARLIAAAPAMDMVLQMISLGIAGIQRSSTTNLVEFCFDGLRYSATNGDWSRVIDAVGWDRCRKAIQKVSGQ